MAAIRIHRSRLDSGFAQVPNATHRDSSLSWAARGYLGEMLSNKDDWEPETAQQAGGRAVRERATKAESARMVERILAELEAAGYRHRIRRHLQWGRFATEVHYYDAPSVPCEDASDCATCRKLTDPIKLRTRYEQGKHRVSPGGTDSAVTDWPVDQPVGGPTGRWLRGYSEDQVVEDHLPEEHEPQNQVEDSALRTAPTDVGAQREEPWWTQVLRHDQRARTLDGLCAVFFVDDNSTVRAVERMISDGKPLPMVVNFIRSSGEGRRASVVGGDERRQ